MDLWRKWVSECKDISDTLLSDRVMSVGRCRRQEVIREGIIEGVVVKMCWLGRKWRLLCSP